MVVAWKNATPVLDERPGASFADILERTGPPPAVWTTVDMAVSMAVKTAVLMAVETVFTTAFTTAVQTIDATAAETVSTAV